MERKQPVKGGRNITTRRAHRIVVDDDAWAAIADYTEQRGITITAWLEAVAAELSRNGHRPTEVEKRIVAAAQATTERRRQRAGRLPHPPE